MIRLGICLLVSSMAAAGMCTRLSAQSLAIETGLDVLHDPATEIEGLHRFYVGVELGRELTFGQAIYSAALGDAGGAFFWGIEGVKRFRLTESTALGASGFLGGGGGAAQVVGDGTMVRVHLFLEQSVAEHWAIQAGVSRVSVRGADIDDGAAAVGMAYRPSATGRDAGSGSRLRSVSLEVSHLRFPDGTTRSGNAQSDLRLVGAEASAFVGHNIELVLEADGAATGADGYMQIFGGVRRRFDVRSFSLFGQASAGFGGGGGVDTGSGLIAKGALGVSMPIGEALDAELSYGLHGALDTTLRGRGVQISLTRVLHRSPDDSPRARPQNWQFTLGISGQAPNERYMKSRVNEGVSPIMQESAIDLFLTDAVYLTGNAQTTVFGGVAGFAIGLIGVGREYGLSENWRLSVEGHVGAAGGGGVDVGKGLMGGLRAEIDYAISTNNSLSLGVGWLRAMDGGADVPIMQLGLKHRFTTN